MFRYALVTLLALAVVVFYRLAAQHVNQTTVALTFVALVLAIASQWRLAYSIYLSVLCTLLYNYYFLPPIGTLTVADPQNWIALAAFLGASVLVSQLSESVHRQSELSERRRTEVERLYEFSQQLLLQDDRVHIAQAAPGLIASTFRLKAVALYVCDQNAAHYSDAADKIVAEEELRAAANSPELAHTPREGIRLVPLLLGLRSTGAIAMREGDYSAGVYGAIGSLVAIAIERANAVERYGKVQAARESERLRAALIDSLTHELRTPLTAIRAAATSLQSQSSLGEAERAEMTAVVVEESARLDRLIGQAVEMAQLDSKAVTVHLAPCRVREVIEQAVEDSSGILRGRQVRIDAADSLPRVAMDRGLIRRVLQHLIENGVKYSPAGSDLVLAARLEDERLLVSVTDYGEGIDPADQPMIFDKFYRGRHQRQRARGTGMGLAIAKAIMVAHGGGIELTSRPGQQTTFTFWIPVRGAA